MIAGITNPRSRKRTQVRWPPPATSPVGGAHVARGSPSLPPGWKSSARPGHAREMGHVAGSARSAPRSRPPCPRAGAPPRPQRRIPGAPGTARTILGRAGDLDPQQPAFATRSQLVDRTLRHDAPAVDQHDASVQSLDQLGWYWRTPPDAVVRGLAPGTPAKTSTPGPAPSSSSTARRARARAPPRLPAAGCLGGSPPGRRRARRRRLHRLARRLCVGMTARAAERRSEPFLHPHLGIEASLLRHVANWRRVTASTGCPHPALVVVPGPARSHGGDLPAPFGPRTHDQALGHRERDAIQCDDVAEPATQVDCPSTGVRSGMACSIGSAA